MQGSVSSIGAVATAFATLSLSVVNTYRAYRDLNDTQIAVDAATKKLHATEKSVKDLKAQINAEQKIGTKGGLDYALAQAKVTAAGEAYRKHQKDGKHTAAELRVEYLALQKSQSDLGKGSEKLTGLQEKLGIAEEGLSVQNLRLGEAVERQNDAYQNFYLSIAPLAISSVATLATTFGTLKTSIGGAGVGGIIGSLGGLGLVLGGLSLGVIAYQNNWLGLKDKIGGVITWVKDRIGLWKQGFEDVFNFIKKGDWNGAFNRIGIAAQKFWQDLKKQVPLLTAVETIVNAIRNGNWKYAFSTIVAAAELMWFELKQKIPFFGGVELFITDIKNGDWAGAWAVVAKGAQDALGGIFGATTITNFITQIQQIPDKLKAAMNEPGATVFSVIDAILPTSVKDIMKWANGVTAEAMKQLAAALTTVSVTWIDPVVAQLFNPTNWALAVSDIMAAGTFAAEVIASFFKNLSVTDMTASAGDVGNKIWTGITTWMTTNAPDTKAAMEALAQKLVDSVAVAGQAWQNLGIAIWNNVIEGLKKIVPGGGAGLDILKLKPVLAPLEGSAIDKWTGNINSQLATKPITAKTTLDTIDFTRLYNETKAKLTALGNMKPAPAVTIKVNGTALVLKASDAINKIHGKTVVVTTIMRTINEVLNTAGRFSNQGAHPGRGSLKGAGGLSKVVSQPTLMMVGEGGRDERVSVTPVGSTGHSGGTGDINVNVGPIYLDGDKIQDSMRYKINKFQSVMK
jgi:hypothetical protein